MSALASLKLTAAKKPINQPAIVAQRNKLSKRLWEQIELARAQQTGSTFVSKKLKSIRDADGVRTTVEVAKRIKPWWFVAENGKVCVNVRYGSKLIELAKNKSAIEVGSAAELIDALTVVKTAVEAGELDSQIELASGALRSGFRK
ncbi:DUF6641 family protein [beta proteobacterium MWH-UniP1]